MLHRMRGNSHSLAAVLQAKGENSRTETVLKLADDPVLSLNQIVFIKKAKQTIPVRRPMDIYASERFVLEVTRL